MINYGCDMVIFGDDVNVFFRHVSYYELFEWIMPVLIWIDCAEHISIALVDAN